MSNEDLVAGLQGPAEMLFGRKKPKKNGPDSPDAPPPPGAELGRRCPSGKILTKGFTRKDGTRVAPFCTFDKGAPGKGPKTLPKPKKGGLKGWTKDAPETVRHAALLKVMREEGCATAIRKMVLIGNITADMPTKTLLRLDREWLRRQTSCKLKSKMGGVETDPK